MKDTFLLTFFAPAMSFMVRVVRLLRLEAPGDPSLSSCVWDIVNKRNGFYKLSLPYLYKLVAAFADVL